jgi:cysteine-rich repeat protein
MAPGLTGCGETPLASSGLRDVRLGFMRRLVCGWAIAGCAAIGCEGLGGRGADTSDATDSTTASGSESSSASAGTDTTTSTTDASTDPTPGTSDPTSASETEPTSTGDDTTDGTGGPDCGNGEVDPGEECDDGNDVPGDGCNNDCVESGKVVWTHTHASGLGPDENWGVTTDADGNPYVAGFVQASPTDVDIYLRGYSRPGGLRWTRTFGVLDAVDQGFDIVFHAGALFVAGTTFAPINGANVWFARYDTSGNQVWQDSASSILFDGDFNQIPGNDGGRAIAAGPDGNLVVAGFFVATGQGQNIWLRKIDPSGAEIWSRTYNGPGNGNDQVSSVAIDSQNNVIIVGFEQAGTRDIFVRKYDAAGGVVWTVTHNGTENLDDTGLGVAVTEDDEIVVAGVEGISSSAGRYFLRRLDVDGNEVWTDTDEGPAGQGAQAREVAVAPGGDLVVAGIEIEEGVWRAIVRRHAPDGERRWDRRYGPAVGESFSLDLAVADDGILYVAGIEDRGIDGRDAWIARLTP